MFGFVVGNTRVVNQKELEFFREELQNRMSSSYNVILKERKLPLSLLNDHQKVWILLQIGTSFAVVKYHNQIDHLDLGVCQTIAIDHFDQLFQN